MNWLLLLTGIFAVLGCGAAGVVGLSRLRGGAAGHRPSQGRAGAPPEPATLEDFGDDLLAQKLARLHNQPSFYDRVIDGLSQRLTFWQLRGLVASWHRFSKSTTEAVGAQNDFARRTAEHPTIALEADKTNHALKADIEEQKRRRAQAKHERLNLGKKPTAARPEGERPVGEQVVDARRWLQEEQERLRKAGVKEGDREWELLLNAYDQRIERLFRGPR